MSDNNNNKSIYKKRPDLLSQKSIDKTETLIQMEQQNKKKNSKYKELGCYPYVINIYNK